MSNCEGLGLDIRMGDTHKLNRADLDTTHQLWRFDGHWQGFDALHGATHMKALGLAMYEWEGYHFIGFTDASQHPHDRWLYRTNVPIAAKAYSHPRPPEGYLRPTWLRLSHHTTPVPVTSLKEDLTALAVALRAVVAKRYLHQVSVKPVSEPMARQARLFRLFGESTYWSLIERDLFDFGKAQHRTLHELLHHGDAFRIKHPEIAALPPHLLLRMLNLGSIAGIPEVCEQVAASLKA